jgi:hypothetical protein
VLPFIDFSTPKLAVLERRKARCVPSLEVPATDGGPGHFLGKDQVMKRGSARIKSSSRQKTRTGRSDRWPSDYGRRDEEDNKSRTRSAAGAENVDEQGERANVRQNTPPKGLRSKR